MSIPLDRLYNYIDSVAEKTRDDAVLIYRFSPHGSKKIEDLLPLKNVTWKEFSVRPQIICHDQEPLNYDMYEIPYPEKQPWGCNLRRKLGNIYDQAILIHSEKQSAEVEKYAGTQFIPVYYWSHALIARDWYRFAKWAIRKKDPKKTFLIYNRAWAGTREYRLKFMELVIQNGLIKHVQSSCSPLDPELLRHYRSYDFKNPHWKPNIMLEAHLPVNKASSNSSADFVIADYDNTEVEVVLETLFDDSRIHLTEKSLRPMAMQQPFLLMAPAGSLGYLRDYGFKTFGEVWNESYDNIVDPVQRMQAVVDQMKIIQSWTSEQKIEKHKLIKTIVAHNFERFFSDEFMSHITQELQTNLAMAFDQLESTNTCNLFFARRRDLYQKIHNGVEGSWGQIPETNYATRLEIADVVNKAKQYKLRSLISQAE